MSYLEICLIGLGLSMDAFAVAVTNGMTKKNIGIGMAAGIGLCFGLFQGLMPAAGFALGSTFSSYIQAFDHVIALLLLGFIGGRMVYDGIKGEKDSQDGSRLTLGVLIAQGVATSIDALAVGVSFAAVFKSPMTMLAAAGIIAGLTFSLSFIGVYIGKKSGDFLNSKAQIVGGLILIGIGVKIFVEHVFFQ
ncbi:MAG TPA: manganese efflux pump [Candidatus Faeciplasma avium]|uniref:Putative manganese efflux pump MntP n=1 Tax=Candidatus Faeciplasma avium TaxID=2840798 RepID=A0A9D1T3Z0_9FIRM|nr:manganese efflux pump [Candidatus Faeciplasma avium]